LILKIKKMFSIYTSLFNYSPEKFDIVDTFSNWSRYADKIVIATFPEQEDEILKVIWKDWYNGNILLEDGTSKAFIDVVSCETSLDDPFFDGKLKNAALQACKTELVIQQDMDECIGGNLDIWRRYGDALLKNKDNYKALMIPVIDLYKNYGHYKSIGYKWYLHLKEGCFRCPVNFAKKEGGIIDTDKSDTCELVDGNGNLVPSVQLTDFVEKANLAFPHIIHLGYLDLDKRVENNKFWQPIWSARKGEIVDVPTDIDSLNQFPYYKHNFPEKWWI